MELLGRGILFYERSHIGYGGSRRNEQCFTNGDKAWRERSGGKMVLIITLSVGIGIWADLSGRSRLNLNGKF